MTDGSGSISLEIAVSLHDTAWLDGCADLEKRSRAAASAVLRHLKVEDGPLELSLVFTDDAEQRALNRAWRNQDRPTNVMSFPNLDDGTMVAAGLTRLLGDVGLARDTVRRGALEHGNKEAAHTVHLPGHGH